MAMQNSEFMSIKEKELVLKQWKNFLKHLKACNFDAQTEADYGCFPPTLNKPFSKKLYTHLSKNFGFIAHFNRLGFLSNRFGSVEDTKETFRQIISDPCYNSSYRDINKSIVEALQAMAT